MLRDIVERMIPFNRRQEEGPQTRLALDIGTEYVKAIYLELGSGGAKVIGVGRSPQDYANMENGAVANISGVEACCRQAMSQGSIMAGVKPKEVVIGIAGQFVQGAARIVERQRPRAEKPPQPPRAAQACSRSSGRSVSKCYKHHERASWV